MLSKARKCMSNIITGVGSCSSYLCIFTTKKTLAMAGVFYAKTFSLSKLFGNPNDPANSIPTEAKILVAAIDSSMLLIYLYSVIRKKQREHRDFLKNSFIVRHTQTLNLVNIGCIRNSTRVKVNLRKDMKIITEIDNIGERKSKQCVDFSFGFMHSAALYAGSNLACILYANAIDYSLVSIANGGFGLSLSLAVVAACYEEVIFLNNSKELSKEVIKLYELLNEKLTLKHTKNKSSTASVAAILSASPKPFLSPTAATSSAAVSYVSSPDASAHLLSPHLTSSPHPSIYHLPKHPTLQDINSREDRRNFVVDVRAHPFQMPGYEA